MRIGASLAGAATAISGAACAGAVALAGRHAGIDGVGPLAGVAGAAAGGAVLLAFLPIAARLDRDVRRIRGYLRSLGRSGRVEPIITTGPLASLRTDLGERLEQIQQRLDAASASMREEQIRRKLAEAERDHAETIVQSLHDAVLVTDAYNDLKLANGRAAELLGFDPEQAVNQPIDNVVHDERLRRIIRDALAAATPNHRKSVDHAVPGGGDEPGERHFDVSLTCLPDLQGSIGSVGGVVTILRDITREREISQMKSDFVSKASHELRTPLSSINAYLEMLLDGEAASDEDKQEFYQIMKNEADRLGRMIDNMLNISRIEAGIVKAKIVDMDFVQASQRAIEVIQPQARLKNISVKVSHGPLMYSAMADQDMMHQVLLNLLSNAVKYTPEGGRVTVTIENDDATGSVMVTIADTGLGIPPDSIDKVFEKFYRIENYKRVASGTGLGLSLVRHIVETVHKGRITVESQLGMGSRFTFLIPYEHQGA
ncbi:MAG: sensor histidine kinase [Phycisphaerales bacterium]